MPKLWYKYHVSRLEMDMLRYDCGCVEEMPAVDQRRSDFYGYTTYESKPVYVYSKYLPTYDRWASFGVGVTNVSRIPRPAGILWTVERNTDGSLVWVGESSR